MAITPELLRRLKDPITRDGTMLDVARHYIGESGVFTNEIIQLFHAIPFLNDYDQIGIDEVLLRIQIANDLLPRAHLVFAIGAEYSGLPAKIEEQTNPALAFAVCHGGICQAEQLAETLNSPLRETLAALARIGVQVSIHFILAGKESLTKGHVKANLIYFSFIEMLALGTKTNAFQYGFTNPEKATPEFFKYLDSIRPGIVLRPGEEKKFRGSIVLGENRIEHLVVPEKGSEFYYIGADEDPPDPVVSP